ncbi:MAG: hypothetical protein R3230_00155 [Nitrosopumilaceae archaeon]|nr:hypothetical protein [Nitrosopumilaceae archaeon]
MSFGKGFAVASIWGSVASLGFFGVHPIAIVCVSVFSMITTVNLD